MTTLFGDDHPTIGGKTTGGPVYQGVNDQIRALFPNHTKDPDVGARHAAVAGIIASARSLAASIDRVSGHAGGRQASGHQLSLMHGQLADLLERLTPKDTAGGDPFDKLSAALSASTYRPPTPADDRAPASPHTPQP